MTYCKDCGIVEGETSGKCPYCDEDTIELPEDEHDR